MRFEDMITILQTSSTTGNRSLKISLHPNEIRSTSHTVLMNFINALKTSPNIQTIELDLAEDPASIPQSFFQDLCLAIQTMPTLNELNISITQLMNLGSVQLSALCNAIEMTPKLEILNLSPNKLNINATTIDEDSFQMLCTAIGIAPALHTLNLSYMNIGTLAPSHLRMLSAAIQSVKQLKVLNLSHNNLANINASTTDANLLQMLCNAIQAASNSLNTLDLSDNAIGKLGPMRLNMLCTIIQKCIHLQNLNLSDNNLANINALTVNADSFQMLCTSIQGSCSLISLNLTNNAIGTLGPMRLNMLCTAIKMSVQLQFLELGGSFHSSFDPEQFKIFCKALQSWKKPHTLGLKDNNFRNWDLKLFEIFCGAIKTDPYLQGLDLSNNNLTRLSKIQIEMLSEAIGAAPNLQNLCLHHSITYISLEYIKILFKGIQTAANLQTLDLSGNELEKLPDEQFAIICTTIQEVPKLSNLILRFDSNLNSLTHGKKLSQLANALKHTICLEILDLGNFFMFPDLNSIFDYCLNNHPSIIEIKDVVHLGCNMFSKRVRDTMLTNQIKKNVILIPAVNAALNDFLILDLINLCTDYLISPINPPSASNVVLTNTNVNIKDNDEKKDINDVNDITAENSSLLPSTTSSIIVNSTTNTDINENNIKNEDEHRSINYVDDQEVKIINDIPQIPQNVDQLIPANASTHEPNFASGVDQALEAAIQASLASYNDNAPKNESNFDHDLNAAIQESLKSVTQAISINQPNISNNINSQSSYTQPIRFTQNNNATNNSANTPQDKPENKADGLENKGNLSNATASLSANTPSDRARREAWLNSLGSKLKLSHRPEAG